MSDCVLLLLLPGAETVVSAVQLRFWTCLESVRGMASGFVCCCFATCGFFASVIGRVYCCVLGCVIASVTAIQDILPSQFVCDEGEQSCGLQADCLLCARVVLVCARS